MKVMAVAVAGNRIRKSTVCYSVFSASSSSAAAVLARLHYTVFRLHNICIYFMHSKCETVNLCV